MGLFDFLKPKKEQDVSFADKPAVRNAMVGMELEYLQKQVANLSAVGRDEDAKKAVAEFVSKYGRESAGQVCPPKDLAQLCYAASYMYLPELVFNRWPDFQQLWASKLPFSVHLAVTVATRMKKRLSAEQVNQFKSMRGSMGEDIDCYVIQYPTPPPQEGELDMDAVHAILAGKGAGVSPPVLGPYYAVVSERRGSDKRRLHVLGQAPGSGTTIRDVAVGSSGNCGAGPDPSSPKDFLRALQRLLK
mgnify:CR=1 FL=1